jgi:hypothetical protein
MTSNTTSGGGGEAQGPLPPVGPGYIREWALFCDYTAAVGQPALPTTLKALTGFLTQVPAHGTTRGRRVAAIAAAHRHAGYLFDHPTHTRRSADQSNTRPDPGAMIAACPTRGWPHGMSGRRDGFLIVLTAVLDLRHTHARRITSADLTTRTHPETSDGSGTHPSADGAGVGWRVGGRIVPASDDPRGCPACAVARWLEILGIADGLGRGSAHMHLSAAHAPTPHSAHRHTVAGPPRWRAAAQLLPAIDRHGWIDDYQPLSTRAIHTRLTLAASRAHHPEPDRTGAHTRSHPEPPPARRTRPGASLDEVLTLLDQVAHDADTLNRYIQTLLTEDHPPHSDPTPGP